MGEPATIGPGLGAFIAFFCLAVALWLLMRNMSARMRRMAYRERDRIAALEAQEAAETAAREPDETPREGRREAPRDGRQERPDPGS